MSLHRSTGSLRGLRSLRSLRTLRTLRSLRILRTLRSLRTLRVVLNIAYYISYILHTYEGKMLTKQFATRSCQNLLATPISTKWQIGSKVAKWQNVANSRNF